MRKTDTELCDISAIMEGSQRPLTWEQGGKNKGFLEKIIPKQSTHLEKKWGKVSRAEGIAWAKAHSIRKHGWLVRQTVSSWDCGVRTVCAEQQGIRPESWAGGWDPGDFGCPPVELALHPESRAVTGTEKTLTRSDFLVLKILW